jgi:hypothetical protein
MLTDEQLLAVVKAVWGHDSFRGRQLELIRGALAGRSMLGVLPTGLGKSLTYQVPALLLQGQWLVWRPDRGIAARLLFGLRDSCCCHSAVTVVAGEICQILEQHPGSAR